MNLVLTDREERVAGPNAGRELTLEADAYGPNKEPDMEEQELRVLGGSRCGTPQACL